MEKGGKKRFCLQKTDVSRDLLSDNKRDKELGSHHAYQLTL